MKAMILLSKGYEEVEALSVVDYLRRAGMTIDMISTIGQLETEGSHGIHILADRCLEDVEIEDYELIVTPGGVVGSTLLANNQRVINLLKKQYQSGRWIASICASPLVLQAAGISEKIEGTCYPGFEKEQVQFKTFRSEIVVNDPKNHVITSRGPATAIYFALEIIRQFQGEEIYEKVSKELLFSLIS